MDLSHYLTANNSVGCTCSSLPRTKVRFFAYCTPRRQNRPSDTQKNCRTILYVCFHVGMSQSDQFIEGFFPCKSMNWRQPFNYVSCANLLSPLSCAKTTTCYPILKTTPTRGSDSSVFDLNFMLSLSFCCGW